MTSTLVFYPLLLAALVLVCVIVHAWRPDPLRATRGMFGVDAVGEF